MADIHALDGAVSDSNGNISKRLAFHFAIPAPDQIAAAAQDPELVGFVSAVPDILPAETANIQAGTVVEEIHTLRYHPTDTNVVARGQAMYTARKPAAIEAYKARYQVYLNTYAET